jgi:transcriptional regulator with GAF, ATPase, and Fis domain
MYDQRLYVRTLSEFTKVLLTPYEVHTVLGELADHVTAVLSLAGSGVSLARGDRLEFDTARGAAVAEVERIQERLQVGPCMTAFRTGQPVAISDLADWREEWPDYCAAAARAGITAVASLAMRMGDQAVGALDLYALGPREWPQDDLAAAAVMADMATGFVLNASHDHKQRELAEQLQHALDSRVVIEQAKGVLVARHRLSPDQAFQRIREHARAQRQNLTEVAEAVVRLELDP